MDRFGRGRRRYDRYVPVSRHTIFVRRLPASVQPKSVKNFFSDESNSNCTIEFVSYTEDKRKLCVALRFDSHHVAKEMLERFNNRDVLGHQVEITWFKDIQSAKERFESRRGRFQRRGGIGGRYRSNRSGSRGNRGRYSRRDSSRERRRSESSSSSGSHSGSESDSVRSSGSPTRLVRDITKEKLDNRRRSSKGSRGSAGGRRSITRKSRERSRDYGGYFKKSRSPKRKSRSKKSLTPPEVMSRRSYEKQEENERNVTLSKSNKDDVNNETKNSKSQWNSLSTEMKIDSIDTKATKTSSSLLLQVSDEHLNEIKAKSEEFLENFHLDIEKYLNFINNHISTHSINEEGLVETLSSVLTGLGDNYVNQLIKYVELRSEQVI